MLNFDVYTGAKDGNVEKGLSYRVVMELANDYLDSQHVDNYFTSVPLFLDLLNRSTYAWNCECESKVSA